jgi:hypothetical protein
VPKARLYRGDCSSDRCLGNPLSAKAMRTIAFSFIWLSFSSHGQCPYF